MGPKPNLKKAQETPRTTKVRQAIGVELSGTNLQKLLKLDYGTQKMRSLCESAIKIQVPDLSDTLLFGDVFLKKHKEYPCKKLESPVEVKVCEATATSPIVNDEKSLYVEEPSEVLQGVQLESIASSSEIRDAIKDEKLKKLICDIDSAMDPEKELYKVMEAEEFRLFTKKILATITP